MVSFWENVLRFIRFFISSSLGLVSVIITPFRLLVKSPKTLIIAILSIIAVIIFLIFILIDMTALENLDN